MVIAYGMCADEPSSLPPGVNGAPVESLHHSQVFCLYSQLPKLSTERHKAEGDVLAFTRVVQAVFASTMILPFRYPTVLRSANEISAFLQQNADGFRSELQRLHGTAELKINLKPSSHEVTTASGTEYLRAKAGIASEQKDLVESVRASLGASLKDWRELSRGDRVVYAALVPQKEAVILKTSIQSAHKPAVDCSGPWPPSDFVTYNPQFPT